MRHLVLTARYVFLQEVLFEEVTWHVLHYILAEVDIGLSLYPVGRLTEFLLNNL